LWDWVAIWLPQQGELLAPIAPQGSISFHAERRQNAIDLVHDRSPFAGQVLPFAMSPARFFIGFIRNCNHRTDTRLAPEPRHQRAQQHFDVNDIRLRSPCTATTGRLEGCITTSTPRRTR
jgi:hypothetical protein